MTRQWADSQCRLIAEAGGWLRLSQRRPDLDDAPPAHLLGLADDLSGNLRYAIQEGRVWLVGEIRTPDVDMFYELACGRLRGLLQDAPPETLPEVDQVEAVLAASGLPWSKREATWVIPAVSGRPREIRVHVEPRGVRVEAVLVSWTERGAGMRDAMARFLCQSHFGLRFCRAALDASSARIVSRAEPSEFFEAELPDSLGSVDTACRLLAREPPALLCDELAAAYAAMPGQAAKRDVDSNR